MAKNRLKNIGRRITRASSDLIIIPFIIIDKALGSKNNYTKGPNPKNNEKGNDRHAMAVESIFALK